MTWYNEKGDVFFGRRCIVLPHDCLRGAVASTIEGDANVEFCDIYNEHREKTGRVQKRSEPLRAGEFFLVVGVWIVNDKKEILITKRAPEKRFMPNRWENTAGHVRTGETGAQAMVRELAEETGIQARPDELILFATSKRPPYLGEEYILRKNVALEEVRLQPGETSDVRWVSVETLEQMMESGEMATSLGIFDPEIRAAFKETLTQCVGVENRASH